jgi:hypothetical protein
MARMATNKVVIHNGRITEWTGSLASAAAPAAPAVALPVSPATNPTTQVPELLGIPLTLLLAVLAALGLALFAVVRRYRPAGVSKGRPLDPRRD